MTREEARKAAEVMMAYANGEKVEGRKRGGAEWRESALPPVFNWCGYEYRVKPKQEKFDPKTLQPFDRVLMMEYCNAEWCCDFFSNTMDSYDPPKYMCAGGMAAMVIPYNDETKHLVGTTDEAPEYYRYWED